MPRLLRWGAGLFLAAALSLPTAYAATVKLFLKDGTYQLAREYKVETDRVRYYSTERGDWEELPLDLVDIKRTQTEIKDREDAIRDEAKAQADEEKAERLAAREIALVPQEPGVYLIAGDKVTVMKVAESKVVNNKGRHLLKLASPIPIITDRSTLEVDGPHAANVVSEARPEFYIRLSTPERFGIVRMGEHKNNRVVEKLEIIPVTKDVVELPDLVEIFRKQVGEDVYRIWPTKPLEHGEYAVVEYTEGKTNMQIWDFQYK